MSTCFCFFQEKRVEVVRSRLTGCSHFSSGTWCTCCVTPHGRSGYGWWSTGCFPASWAVKLGSCAWTPNNHSAVGFWNPRHDRKYTWRDEKEDLCWTYPLCMHCLIAFTKIVRVDEIEEFRAS